jgi:hypothetical protein
VTGWNTSDHVQQATMSTWDIPAGEWEMRVGQGAVHVTLERSASVPVEFAAHGETVLDSVWSGRAIRWTSGLIWALGVTM